jgi:hypothetical protein
MGALHEMGAHRSSLATDSYVFGHLIALHIPHNLSQLPCSSQQRMQRNFNSVHDPNYRVIQLFLQHHIPQLVHVSSNNNCLLM